MIIDCHTHLGRNEHIKASVKELLSSMDVAKIDKALVFAGHINDCTNRWMMKEIKPHSDRLLGVASVNLTEVKAQPGTTGVSSDDMSICDMLDTLNQGAVAIKLYTGYEHFAPNSDRVRHILGIVEKYNKPVIFHTGDCLASVHHAKLRYAQPLDIDDVAVDYPNTNFIIAHMGYPWIRESAEVCYKNKNVFADISGFVYKHFEGPDLPKFQKVLQEFLDIADSDKLLFGTDWPISNQASYLDALDWVSAHTTNRKMSEMFSAKYMSQNVKKVFNL